ncbi:alpha-hemoglobin-stabilizing protein [Chionomys nivalis]|uniref:alpha-hemoglobin-stabilizing protein n=1 Tax=Chionomys nivalis TaxID=269649 RepID=UPI00259A5DE4|nr:alpha-hemoglobin-stabilizing protein [Chionomys nivalis]
MSSPNGLAWHASSREASPPTISTPGRPITLLQDLEAGRFRLKLALDSAYLPLSAEDTPTLKSVAEATSAPLDLKMAPFQTNKELISTGIKEFNVLLNQQVFNDPLIPEESMVIVVDDWVNLYINYYKNHVLGEQQEKDKVLQELQQELSTLGSQFLTKYRTILKTREPSNRELPSS